METTKTDKMLKDFFSERKQEIADNRFTQRIMRKLPEQPDRSWIVWGFACIGMMLSLYLGFSTGTIQTVFMYLLKIPFYYLVGVVFCFPLVGSVGLYFAQNRNY